MNRFRIALGAEETFEKLWRERDSYLDGVPGFREFHLLRGPSNEECTLYASHTVWASREAFEAWTESESFRKAHQQARAPAGTYLGQPNYAGFEGFLWRPPLLPVGDVRDVVPRHDRVRGEPAAVHLERIARGHDAGDPALVERLEVGDPHDPPVPVGIRDRERDLRVAHPERLHRV